MKIFFVAGTDTGVGKTIVAGAMASALRLKGYRVAVMKPISCGGLEDARFLIGSSGCSDPTKWVNPIALKHPLSPNVAAKLENKAIDLKAVDRAFQYFRKKNPDFLIIEGCGGLLVPITSKFYVVDLIKRLKAKAILVSRSALGAINHSLLSIEALRAREIEPVGLIFSRTSGGSASMAEKTNPDVVQNLSGVPVLGVFPYLKKCSSDCAGKAFLKSIDLTRILC